VSKGFPSSEIGGDDIFFKAPAALRELDLQLHRAAMVPLLVSVRPAELSPCFAHNAA
jgi:hypothetical protein